MRNKTVLWDVNINSGAVPTSPYGLISVNHYEDWLHKGRAYSCNVSSFSIPNNGSLALSIYCPSGSLGHFEFFPTAEDDAIYSLVESATLVASGSVLADFSHNRVNLYPSSVYVTNNCSFTGGLNINDRFIANGNPQTAGNTNQWMLKPETIYVLQIFNISGGSMKAGVNIEWVEEERT